MLDRKSASTRDAVIRGISDMERLQAFVAYENAHQERSRVLSLLSDRAEDLQ